MLGKVKVIWAAILAELKDIWNRGKMVLLALLALIGIVEFKKIQEWLLAYMAQKELKSANNKDQTLATSEKADNDAANTLVQDANDLQSLKKPVTSDWYKKEQK
jgi:hypothetical protein